MLIALLLLLVAFLVIWLVSDFAIVAVEKLSSHTRLSKLTLSLFVLGTISSFPEISVTLNSLLVNAPQIALGNLIGTQIFLLFFVIPMLAIATRGMHLELQMKNTSLALCLLVVSVPMLALLNQSLDLGEVLVIVGIYVIFVLIFSRRATFLERIAERIEEIKHLNLAWEVLKLVGCLAILLIAGNTVVRQIIEIAGVLQTPRFLLSLVLLPIGTNLPEISVALKSLMSGRKDWALADYMGALTFNSLLIALLMFGNQGAIYIGQNITWVVACFVLGVIVFWWFCFSRKLLSIKEGSILLAVYLLLLGIAGWQSVAQVAT